MRRAVAKVVPGTIHAARRLMQTPAHESYFSSAAIKIFGVFLLLWFTAYNCSNG